MLTTNDVNKIITAVEKIFDRSIDDKLRPFKNEFGDFRGEFREFKQEMHEFKQEMYEFRGEMHRFKGDMTEFKGDMIEFKDSTQKILGAIFDDLQEKHQTEKQFKTRLVGLEKIHPDFQHPSVL
jgi:archaellum component FlaC